MSDTLIQIVLVLVPMMLSLSVHEWAHAWTAFQLGDDTAAQQGRLTLNPISHIDPVGTLILPGLLVFSGAGMFFGWAKPVPISPSRFSRKFSMNTSVVLTAAAGPFSNLVLAALMAALMSVFVSTQFVQKEVIQYFLAYYPSIMSGEIVTPLAAQKEAILLLVVTMFYLNILLALFNLVPVPPLDGNRVLVGLLPRKAEQGYQAFLGKNPAALPIAFMALIMWGGELIGPPMRFIGKLLLTLAGVI